MPAPLRAVVDVWLAQQGWWPADAVENGADGPRAHWESSTACDLAPGVAIWLLRVRDGVTVQVPLVLAVSSPSVVPLEKPAGHLGTATLDGVSYQVTDGTHDASFHRSLLRQLHWVGGSRGFVPPAGQAVVGTVLAGHQSNTSILLPTAGTGLIVKVLRCVVDGAQPDLDVPQHLAAAGFGRVPLVRAVLEADVDDGTYLAGWRVTLAIASDLVPEAEDGFTRACAYAAGGTSYAGPAGELGSALARLHDALRRAYPVQIVGIDSVPDAISERIDDAATRSREVRALLGPIDTYLAVLRRELTAAARGRAVGGAGSLDADLPVTRQRIHGDLHLGQTLWSPQGWWVLDFEGEPLRPLPARVRPDLPERDIAGMLRSFDYAAALAEGPSAEWASQARESLLASYLDAPIPDNPRTPPPPARRIRELVIEAFELDKAAYEVGYELQHRPAWAPIPLKAVHRILAPYI